MVPHMSQNLPGSWEWRWFFFFPCRTSIYIRTNQTQVCSPSWISILEKCYFFVALGLHHPEINWVFIFQWLLLGALELSWYLQAWATEELGLLIIKFIQSYCKWRQTASSPNTCWYNLPCWPQVWDTDFKWNIWNRPSLPLIDNNNFFFLHLVYSLCYLWRPFAKEDSNITLNLLKHEWRIAKLFLMWETWSHMEFLLWHRQSFLQFFLLGNSQHS